MKIGGITGRPRRGSPRRMAFAWSNHLFVEVSAHPMCATPTAHGWKFAEWFNPIIERPLRVIDGCVVVPDDRPGTEVERNESAVERYKVE